ncbi:MAG: hypothetical protein R3284_04785 [Rubricoccaceae bacterium]|nr:hypothetical protein [Rubricoccaceae bacterium]
MLRVHFLVLILAGTALMPVAHSQGSNNYGSPYSRFGLGERLGFSSSMADALGGAGTAMRLEQYIGVSNPALWADRSYTHFSASGEFRGLETTNGADATSQASGGGLTGIALGLPIVREAVGATIAFQPYSRVDYRAVQEGEALPDEGTEPIPYVQNLEGSGGLYRFRGGLGVKAADWLRIGASADVVFGRVEYIQRTEFPNNSNYLETRNTRSSRLSGFSGTVGAVLTRQNVGGEGNGLHVGASLTFPTRLTGTTVTTLGVSLDRDTLSVMEDGQVTIPLSAQVGVAYTGQERWTVVADALYEPWSSFESDFSFGGFEPDQGIDELRNRFRVSGGFQFLPAGSNRFAGYFARTAYRLGFYRESAYFAPSGQNVSTLAVTAGISLPMTLPVARFDLGFEAGMRGSTDGILVQDLFLKGTATINFGERWFVRRRLG